MALTVSMPQSGLRDTNEYIRPRFRWNTDNGFGRVYEILHPLLSFGFKTLTFNIYQDDALFPRQFNDEPNIVPLLQDIVSLLCRGHLMKFENSPSGRNELKFEGVLAKEIVFDWSTLNVNYYDETDQNASLIAETLILSNGTSSLHRSMARGRTLSFIGGNTLSECSQHTQYVLYGRVITRAHAVSRAPLPSRSKRKCRLVGM
jgi:hypothetical protein